MKKNLFLSFCLISFTVVSAQRIKLPISDVKSLLCKQWKYTHVVDENKISVPSHLRNVNLVFYDNYEYGTVINGVEKKGSWCYNEENKNIELTTPSGDQSTRIFLLEENKVIIIYAKDILQDKTTLPSSYSQLSPR